MPTETVLSFLNCCTAQERLEFQVVIQCAPVLKGVKMSNLIVVKQGSWQRIRRYLRASRIISVPLYADQDKEVLFLYRYEQLERHLKQPKVRAFLKRCGYDSCEIPLVFKRLRRQYQLYKGAGGAFPHELGVLLEYPVEDVKSFIENQGENSLAARYWKVYHNLPDAERIFQIYDEAKEQALYEIINGRSLEQVALF